MSHDPEGRDEVCAERLSLAWGHIREGELDRALELCLALAAEARDAGDPRVEADAWALAGQIHGRRDAYLPAIDALETAVTLQDLHGLTANAAYTDLALVASNMGDLDGAVRLGETALARYAEGSTSPALYATTLSNLAHVLMDLERYDEAEGRFRETLELPHVSDHAHVGSLSGLVVSLCHLDRADEAAEGLERLRAYVASHAMGPYHAALGDYAAAHLALATGGPGALEHALECVAVASHLGLRLNEAQALELAARAAAAQGDHAAAYEYLGRASKLRFQLEAGYREHALALQSARHEAAVARVRNDELARALDLRTRFLAMVTHELRTPLTGILGATSLLHATPLDARQAELVGWVQRSGDDMLGLVGDLLDAAQLEAGAMDLRQGAARIATLARDAIDRVRATAEQQGVQLRLDVHGDTPTAIRGDERRLRQVVINLLANAVKFSPADSTVHVTVHPEGDSLQVIVDDQGPGIPEAERDRVFQPFEQVDGGPSSLHGGTGLGLSIAAQLVQLHGGRISVGESPSGGARFTVEIPAIVVEAPEPSPVEETPPRRFARPLDLLVVDDDPICRHVQGAMLTHLGARVRTADSGPAALGEVASARPDLVFLDWMMPDMSGPDVARALRARGFQGPIVALTANADERLDREGADAGMQQILAKPARLDEMRRAVERWT